MSATGRGAVRDPQDFYGTPRWAVDAVLPYVKACGDLSEADILEPSAGRGAIVKALIDAGADPAKIVAVEPNPERCKVLAGLGVHVYEERFESFASSWIRAQRPVFDVSVMNPPFSEAETHIQLARTLTAGSGVVASLCRLAFFSEGQERASFRENHPHDRLELVKRPSFTAEALAYLDTSDLLAMARKKERAAAKRAAAKAAKKNRKPRPLDDRVVALVRTRLRRTDSCAYAWGLFGDGRGGWFWTHEEDEEDAD